MPKSDHIRVININRSTENSLRCYQKCLERMLADIELFMEQIKFNLAFWLILLFKKKKIIGWYVIILFLKIVKTLFEHVAHNTIFFVSLKIWP